MPVQDAERVFFPFTPNWREPVKVSYQFKTDMFTTSNGTEQRRALRQSPRKKLTFSILLTGDRARSFYRMMETAQNHPFIMPEFTRRARTVGSITAGAASFNIAGDDVPTWVKAGAELVLSDKSVGSRVVKVLSLAGQTVNLTAPTTAFPAACAVYPALTGQLEPELSGVDHTRNISEFEIAFDVEPGSEVYSEGSVYDLVNGYEIFNRKPNWQSGIENQLAWPIEQVDFGFGVIDTYRLNKFAKDTRTEDHVFFSASEAEDVLAFLCRMRGMRGEFMSPSVREDLICVGSVTAGQSTIRIKGEATFDSFADDPVRQYIAVYLPGGSVEYRKIQSMTVAAAGFTDITVDTAWTATGTPARVSWLLQSRFASDEFEFEWLTDQVARCRLSIQSLSTGSGLTYSALRNTLVGDDRETLSGDSREVIYI